MTTANPQIAKWEQRYSTNSQQKASPPSPLLPQAISGIKPGTALDLACGVGRHALWLAALGWHVDAVDGSKFAIEQLQQRAATAGHRDRLAPCVADLEAASCVFPIRQNHYDLIVDCHFLHRPLFNKIRDGIRPGGLFVAALHIPAKPDASTENRKRGHHNYLLKPGELLALAEHWQWDILHSCERSAPPEALDQLGTAELIVRKPNI